MTANKKFKRLVRERARRTGESYTAALRHLRQPDAKERSMQERSMQWQSIQWQRIEKTEFGYAISVPADWAEFPPNLKNSPMETARWSVPDLEDTRLRSS